MLQLYNLYVAKIQLSNTRILEDIHFILQTFREAGTTVI